MPAKGSKRATAESGRLGRWPYALDLDGVIWLADDPIPGAADAVARLRAAGQAVVFCTNNSSQPVGVVEAKLARQGIPAEGDVVTSAMAAAALVEPGERVLVCAGPGVVEALEARGAIPVRDGDADAVMVGFHLDFDYDRLRVAATAVPARRPAARRRTTTPPTRRRTGPIPGGGAILAAVATATGVRRRGGRQALRADGRPDPGPPRARRARWWAIGPTPTAASRSPSATASPSC